jgi:hypothetical protein
MNYEIHNDALLRHRVKRIAAGVKKSELGNVAKQI